jgi:hypothetical protein
MALKCVTCGLLFRSRNELDWHIRQEHLQQRLPPTKDSRRRARLHPRTGGDSGLRDVLELATVTALSKGGTVYVLPAGEVPGGGSAAAVFRYPAQAYEAVPVAAAGVLG